MKGNIAEAQNAFPGLMYRPWEADVGRGNLIIGCAVPRSVHASHLIGSVFPEPTGDQSPDFAFGCFPLAGDRPR